MARFLVSNTLSAFSSATIGSKVVDKEAFTTALSKVVDNFDMNIVHVEGQYMVHLPESSWSTVSAGIGHRSDNPNDYVVRMHRGQPGMFLRRELAVTIEGLHAVVYTREAYLKDPDVMSNPNEIARIESCSWATHIVVAILAFAGPQAPLTPYRLAHNLAGGNNEVDTWTKDDIVAKAHESIKYWDEWAVVAD